LNAAAQAIRCGGNNSITLALLLERNETKIEEVGT